MDSPGLATHTAAMLMPLCCILAMGCLLCIHVLYKLGGLGLIHYSAAILRPLCCIPAMGYLLCIHALYKFGGLGLIHYSERNDVITVVLCIRHMEGCKM